MNMRVLLPIDYMYPFFPYENICYTVYKFEYFSNLDNYLGSRECHVFFVYVFSCSQEDGYTFGFQQKQNY